MATKKKMGLRKVTKICWVSKLIQNVVKKKLKVKRTSSLRRIRPSKGRDMDHWFRQSSNIIILSTVLSICCKISGCSSKTFKNISGAPIFGFLFFAVSCLNRNVTMWSSVAQHPVQTIVSTTKKKTHKMIPTGQQNQIQHKQDENKLNNKLEDTAR